MLSVVKHHGKDNILYLLRLKEQKTNQHNSYLDSQFKEVCCEPTDLRLNGFSFREEAFLFLSAVVPKRVVLFSGFAHWDLGT